MERLRRMLSADLKAAGGRTGLRHGVAATIYDPAFSAVVTYRVAAQLHAAGWRRIGKLAWRASVACSGCHIHLDAAIAPGLSLPHPTGIVIGSGARLGRCVTIYQNVTIGAGYRDARYPIIGDDVVILPNAVIAGGITIGDRSVIGAGALVIDDVAADCVMAGSPARVLRSAHAGP